MQRALSSALSLASRAAEAPPRSAPPDGRPRRWRVAMGDPQAPLEHVLAVLAHADLLGVGGRLRPEVQLLSVGDHFDWGAPSARARAARDGLSLLAWLASHPSDQVLLCAGNHDLSRVGELSELDDAQFGALQARADALSPDDAPGEARFLELAPSFASSGLVRRDLSTFRAVQRRWIRHLLIHRRLRLAFALGPSLLLTHAGVTLDEASVLGLPHAAVADAARWARTLNGALDAAWRTHRTGPFSIPGLYRPGSAARGEGVGMVYHRASVASATVGPFGAPPRRRFPPSRLPRGLTQVVGHVRDEKSRSLLGLPTSGARVGVLRSLTVSDTGLAYSLGTRPLAEPSEAVVLHIDGSMNACPPSAYGLLDIDALKRWRAP